MKRSELHAGALGAEPAWDRERSGPAYAARLVARVRSPSPPATAPCSTVVLCWKSAQLANLDRARVCRIELGATPRRNEGAREFVVKPPPFMSHPTHKWLLEPTFPAAAGLPRLDRELLALIEADLSPDDEPASSECLSGTWRVRTQAQHGELDDADAERFATSDSEAPTVRPGSLHASKKSG